MLAKILIKITVSNLNQSSSTQYCFHITSFSTAFDDSLSELSESRMFREEILFQLLGLLLCNTHALSITSIAYKEIKQIIRSMKSTVIIEFEMILTTQKYSMGIFVNYCCPYRRKR